MIMTDRYEGELDEYGDAYGEGVLKWDNDIVRGTWRNNKKHGYCEWICQVLYGCVFERCHNVVERKRADG